MRKIKDAATRVFNREKTTALSEIFALELKFTIDMLTRWFNTTFKQKFLELNHFQKKRFLKKNLLIILKPPAVFAALKSFFLHVKDPNEN